MAFWGTEVKPGKPVTHSSGTARGRLRISQATLGIGDATKKSLVQCNVGNKSPVLLCALLPNITESCHLDLEFEEADDVVFSVIGPRSVYLTGYYVNQSRHLNPQSDTESFGVDIENTGTEGSSHCSSDDKYEDSFIDDGELQVSSPAPVSVSDDEERLESKKPKDDKGNLKRIKKRYQVIESDDDANQHENGDKDDCLFGVFKDRRAEQTTKPKAGENNYNGQGTVEADDNLESSIPGNELEEKTALDVMTGPESLKKKRKRKQQPEQEEKILEVENGNYDGILGVWKKQEVVVKSVVVDPDLPPANKSKATDVVIDGDHLVAPVELSSESCQKSKKRRKELGLEGTCTRGDLAHCKNDSKVDETKKDIANAASVTMDLQAASIAPQEKDIGIDSGLALDGNQSENKPEGKKKKKKSNKSQSNGDLIENENNTLLKSEHQYMDAASTDKRTLSNGLIIEEIAKGEPDGKIATSGKKVKVYYTGMVKETGQVFDSNVGKAAYKFRLGDEGIIDGWNTGIIGMRVGDKRRLIIPPSMGCQNEASLDNVPPNSWLVYDVELAGVRR